MVKRRHIEKARESLGEEPFPLGEILEKAKEVSPREAEEILEAWEDASRAFIEGEADIKEEALRKRVNVTERFALMFKFWAEENLDDNQTA